MGEIYQQTLRLLEHTELEALKQRLPKHFAPPIVQTKLVINCLPLDDD